MERSIVQLANREQQLENITLQLRRFIGVGQFCDIIIYNSNFLSNTFKFNKCILASLSGYFEELLRLHFDLKYVGIPEYHAFFNCIAIALGDTVRMSPDEHSAYLATKEKYKFNEDVIQIQSLHAVPVLVRNASSQSTHSTGATYTVENGKSSLNKPKTCVYSAEHTQSAGGDLREDQDKPNVIYSDAACTQSSNLDSVVESEERTIVDDIPFNILESFSNDLNNDFDKHLVTSFELSNNLPIPNLPSGENLFSEIDEILSPNYGLQHDDTYQIQSHPSFECLAPLDVEDNLSTSHILTTSPLAETNANNEPSLLHTLLTKRPKTQHKRTKLKRKCPFCNKNIQKINLHRHINVCHRCSHCNLCFKTRQKMHTHFKKSHSKDDRFLCDKCHTIYNPTYLPQHKKTCKGAGESRELRSPTV